MPVTASAPGKVLITGGYVVLDRPNAGLVAGVSARVHVTADTVALPATRAELVAAGGQPAGLDANAPDTVLVTLLSPQYNSFGVFAWNPETGVTSLEPIEALAPEEAELVGEVCWISGFFFFFLFLFFMDSQKKKKKKKHKT
jgi:hypothetical protein